MRITKIGPSFTSNSSTENRQTNFLDKIYEKTKNSADMTDTIVVPRTIFKGYLGIMTGTTLLTLGGILNKCKRLSRGLNLAGVLTSLYGTWAFVRPFIIKDCNGVAHKK